MENEKDLFLSTITDKEFIFIKQILEREREKEAKEKRANEIVNQIETLIEELQCDLNRMLFCDDVRVYSSDLWTKEY